MGNVCRFKTSHDVVVIMRIVVAYVWVCMTHHMTGRNFILADDTDAYFI